MSKHNVYQFKIMKVTEMIVSVTAENQVDARTLVKYGKHRTIFDLGATVTSITEHKGD